MPTRYPDTGAYTCAADLYRALLSAAAHCEPAPDWLTPARAMHWTPPEIVTPEWVQAGPDDVPEFFVIASSSTWIGGAWVPRLTHTADSARPKMAFHGPGRPHMDAPRLTFAFRPGPGASASFTVAGTHARLHDMAERVRKHWTLYGGGPKLAEHAKPARPRVVTWPAAVVKAWRLAMEGADHVGAMLAGERIGAVYFHASGAARAIALAAPVQVEGLPDGICSVFRSDGQWVVSCMVSGLKVGERTHGSRAAAEREALQRWASIEPTKRDAALIAARKAPADMEAGRAAWCKAHGIEDPAAEDCAGQDAAQVAAVGQAIESAAVYAVHVTEPASAPAPAIMPAGPGVGQDAAQHAEACHMAAAALQRFGVSGLDTCRHLPAFPVWHLDTLREYRLATVGTARAAWQLSHAEGVGARLRAALAALREVTPPDAAALPPGTGTMPAAARAAVPTCPLPALAAVPHAAAPCTPPVAPIQIPPTSTNPGRLSHGHRPD